MIFAILVALAVLALFLGPFWWQARTYCRNCGHAPEDHSNYGSVSVCWYGGQEGCTCQHYEAPK